MAIFKCKMCGGSLDVSGESSVVTCDYCGSVQTLPKKNDDIIANLFNRANNLRIKCEFDKATEVYEKILNEDNNDSEAHWGLVLCKYGIEYVEDPKTYKRIPTCHRTQYESVLTDVDYLAAVSNADVASRDVYKAQGEEIANLQKDILAIVKNEKPFDVFICYKETDENGKRTVDSALANDIYYQLTQEGMKVFYAAITLEDKLGVEYEPYIFAALNSARVMLVVGTRPEFFDSIWVKNEWSRYLKLMKNDRSKLLIPCYRDMDAYDLPEEFSHLQAQDMAKIGFVNDVVRGIRKIIKADEPSSETAVKETAAVSAGSSVAPLLKRAFMFLEDGDWQSANEYCEKVLDLDPECAEAYLGKLMADFKVGAVDKLAESRVHLSQNANYQKIMRFGDNALVEKLEAIEHTIIENERKRLEAERIAAEERRKAEEARRKEEERKRKEAENEKAYNRATDLSGISMLNNMNAAIGIFESLGDYKDSREQVEKTKERIYNGGISCLKSQQWQAAVSYFASLGDYKDSKAKKEEAYAGLAAEEVKQKEFIKKIIIIFSAVVAVLILIGIIVSAVNKSSRYKDALEIAESGNYAQAIVILRELEGYKDSDEKIIEFREGLYAAEKRAETEAEEQRNANAYNEAVSSLNSGDKVKAALLFGKLSGYKDAKEKSLALWQESAVKETVSAGYSHTVAVKSDGTVVAVGNNDYGQCNVSDWTDIVEVSTGVFHTVGLKSDGTVVATGDNENGQCNVSDWTDIVDVSVGKYHTVGLKSDGTVVAVGLNGYGQCNVTDWTDIVRVSAEQANTVGLKFNGTVVAVGDNAYGQRNVTDWTDIVAVSTAAFETVGLKSDGTVVEVGYDVNRNKSNVSGWTGVVSVSKGSEHVVGLKSDGTVVATGNEYHGQCDVSDWTDIVAVSAEGYYTVGIKSDGTVVAVGENNDGQCNVSDWSDIVAVSQEDDYVIGLKSDGTVVAVGNNENGQCNVSDWTDIKIPE